MKILSDTCLICKECSEAAIRGILYKKVVLEISQNLQENVCKRIKRYYFLVFHSYLRCFRILQKELCYFQLSCLHFNALFSSILVESRFIRQNWNAITKINLFTSVDTRLQLLGCMTVTDSYLISEFSFIQVLLFVVTYNKNSLLVLIFICSSSIA